MYHEGLLTMADLKSPRLIVAKGIMFAVISFMSVYIILDEYRSLKVAVLLGLLVWASCRFYYFLFYVLEKYVDPRLRYAGIIDLVARIAQGRLLAGGTKQADAGKISAAQKRD